MPEESLAELITEAQNFLEKTVMNHPLGSLPEHSCNYRLAVLLEAFSNCADMRFFRGAYQLTSPLFTWFCKKRLDQARLTIPTESITNKMYGILCEYLHLPSSQFPMSTPIEWCYCVLENLVLYETTQKRARGQQDDSQDLESIIPTVADCWTRKRNLTEANRVEEQVIETLLSEDAQLNALEKEVLFLYYGEGLTRDRLASKLEMPEEKVAELIRLSRDKVLQEVYLQERHRLWDLERKEEQQ